ncbi:MAG: Smr/MutS family protein [Gammaproteobacteria bacterium]|nr:Smr/MutS family protein [Gammaproteobacteria bacterium]
MSDDDDSEFARMVPGVRRLHQDRVSPYLHRPARATRATRQDTPREIRATAVSAGTPAEAAQFNTGLQRKLQRRIRRGEIRPEARLDLHGLRQHEALAALDEFLAEVLAAGLRMVVIIHGQGLRSQRDAVLKPLTQRWLASCPEVLAWCPAQPRDGAAGATYAYLRAT